ncbi:cell cycle control protein 50A-like [Melitaea cinxia]|uniref:cell cycle control protein 50A-like n=1 Tax=Melitaea cinxia TaxID=113334 RepID=UPI001E272135|nr:cell cycle control protein 50A-like [Melitaea cinxia]
MEPDVSPKRNYDQAGAVAPEEKKLTSTSELEDGTNYSVAPDLRTRTAKQIERCSKVFLAKDFIISVVSIALVIIGIIFLTRPRVSISSREKIVDYTDCTILSFDLKETKTCKESQFDYNAPCICLSFFNVTEELEGNLEIYYELETFDQSRNDYVKSRDDNQLKGELAIIPSENCEPYRYDTVLREQKPIYPCGAIADSMFNDTFELINISKDEDVPFIAHGLLTEADKLRYRNPKRTIDFQNFTKPKSWSKSIWELDTTNPENNGVQVIIFLFYDYKWIYSVKSIQMRNCNRPMCTKDKFRKTGLCRFFRGDSDFFFIKISLFVNINERFIGWMKTELKRKPYARVDQNQTVFAKGLLVGEYRLRIGYNYPPALYRGRRTFIISASVLTSTITFSVVGIALLLFGLILLAKTVAIFMINNYVKNKENERPASGENLTNNR